MTTTIMRISIIITVIVIIIIIIIIVIATIIIIIITIITITIFACSLVPSFCILFLHQHLVFSPSFCASHGQVADEKRKEIEAPKLRLCPRAS